MGYKSIDARQLANERRAAERERTLVRHAARTAKRAMLAGGAL